MIVYIIFVIVGFICALLLAGLAPRLPMWSRARLKTRQKVVALTFDDGPSTYTPKVLEILEDKNIRATFFLVGENVRQHPEIAQRVVMAGHTVGNHSDDHNLSRQIVRSGQRTLQNIQTTNHAIFTATGLRPRLYRPPHGFRSPWGARALKKAGFSIITWDNMTLDYLDRSPPDWIERRIVRKTRPGGIIVLHDGLETKREFYRGNMLQALPNIIDTLKASGYSFVGIEELFNEEPYFVTKGAFLPKASHQKTRS